MKNTLLFIFVFLLFLNLTNSCKKDDVYYKLPDIVHKLYPYTEGDSLIIKSKVDTFEIVVDKNFIGYVGSSRTLLGTYREYYEELNLFIGDKEYTRDSLHISSELTTNPYGKVDLF